MAQNKQRLVGDSTELAIRQAIKTGVLTRVLRFLGKTSLKVSLGIWSLSQLRKESKDALDCWESACQLTNQAITVKTAAASKLNGFHSWLAALEPEYKTRHSAALHARQRKLEIAAYEANYNFTALDQQERRWIKRLIKLKRLGHLVF
ncbi:MAG: hypothetical protein Q8T09_22550 [Candidatus Melainabacteria bacterium]|nr:hypothetical protein [Candidatus Melainabacteria bacterium]